MGLSVTLFADPECNRVKERFVGHRRSLTVAGREYIVRSILDPNRPAVASVLGIGWGEGASTPFNEAHTDLQAVNKSYLAVASFQYDPADAMGIVTATWGIGSPSTNLIFVGEVGFFDTYPGGRLLDRLVIPPTPKQPYEPLMATAAIRVVQSSVGYQFF